jgi:GNAT superfamily N-acetyltransferase
LGQPSTQYRFDENEEGVYVISNLYVSRALQGGGLGSAVLDTVEKLAVSEPLLAKTLALNAINKDDPEREEKYKALELTIPPVSIFILNRGCTDRLVL